MNKKFSTLVASLLLASSVGAFAATYTMSSPIQMKITNAGQTVKPTKSVWNATTNPVVYKVGQAYYLGVGNVTTTPDNVLSIDTDNNTLEVALLGKRIDDNTIKKLQNDLSNYNLSNIELQVTEKEITNKIILLIFSIFVFLIP